MIGLLLRSLWVRAGLNVRQTVVTLGVAAVLIAIVALTVTGRLNWIVAVLAAMIPLVRRLGALVRIDPLARRVVSQAALRGRIDFKTELRSRQHHHRKRLLPNDAASRVRPLDGEIKLGAYKGHFLSELDVPKLVGLLAEIRDYDSQRLLESYLDHHHPEWRSNGKRGPAAEGQNLTRSEALAALGLAENATRDEIVAAHRRLIQKLHPDRGGSTYLAALLNRAKDTLIKDH